MRKKKFKTWKDKRMSILSGYRRKLRRNPTVREEYLVALFKHYKIHALFQKGWMICGGTFYISDFYLPFCKTVIEVDGASHDDPKQKDKDKEKDAYYASRGFKVLRLNMR